MQLFGHSPSTIVQYNAQQVTKISCCSGLISVETQFYVLFSFCKNGILVFKYFVQWEEY